MGSDLGRIGRGIEAGVGELFFIERDGALRRLVGGALRGNILGARAFDSEDIGLSRRLELLLCGVVSRLVIVALPAPVRARTLARR